MDERRLSALLVTGGAGFIGANFTRFWLDRHPDSRIVVLDKLTYAGHRSSLSDLDDHPGFEFVHGDICDRELVQDLLRRRKLDTIVHFAAESHVDRSIAASAAFVETNVVGTHSLLEAARSVWLEQGAAGESHRFHHVSTDEVYGSLGLEDPPFTESSLYRPNSPYAASKAGADHLVRAYHKTHGLRTTVSNCSNNYGPYQYPEKLIPLCILNLLRGRELPIYGDGSNVRDWLHVRDHCAGIERVLERGRDGSTYNLGGNAERTNLELVTEICRRFDLVFAESPELAERFPLAPPALGAAAASKITFVRDRPGHDRRYAIDPRLAVAELGYEPGFDLASGLERTLRWYLENQQWWLGVMGQEYGEWMKRQYSTSPSDSPE
jgi:dTDP-glucose 4,6-dehydratase